MMRRIVAETAGKAFRTKSGKISGALGIGNQGQLGRGGRLGKKRFRVVGEEEQLVLDDWAAESAAILVVNALRDGVLKSGR